MRVRMERCDVEITPMSAFSWHFATLSLEQLGSDIIRGGSPYLAYYTVPTTAVHH